MLGVPASRVFETLEVYLGSAYVNDFNFLGRTFQVRAQADGQFRQDLPAIENFKTRSDSGAMVPLSSVATFEERTGPYRVPRYNLYPAAEVQGAAAAGFSTGQALDRMEQIAAEILPEGYGFEWTELALQERLAGNTGLLVFAASVVFVFLLLAAQYESWTLPLSVILIVPMCLLAALTGLLVFAMDVNILAQIGFVVLIGLAAKNAILIVEFARQAEDEGMSRVRRGDPGGARAPASDPDDLFGFHSRRRAARARHRRRRRDAPIARHDGLLRHARRHGFRADFHAGLLCGLPCIGEVWKKWNSSAKPEQP